MMISRRRIMLSGLNPINVDNYLTIEALEDGLTISFSNGKIQCCLNGNGAWRTLTSGTKVTINSGETISFKANLTSGSSSRRFSIDKKCNLLGNCMSLYYGDNAATATSAKANAFAYLFYGQDTIVNVSKNFLPATTLADDCYQYMFEGCTSLVNAPELPVTTLADDCYHYMFSDCTSLVNAPALPATTLAVSCYSMMFKGCTSLVTAPELLATTLAENCCSQMFYGCTSLVAAPELLAAETVRYCYQYMFNGCSSLKYIKMLAKPRLVIGATTSWVEGVSSTGTFVKRADAEWYDKGVDGVPEGWTIEYADS